MRELKINTYYEYCTPNKDIRYVFKVLEKTNDNRYEVIVYASYESSQYKKYPRQSTFWFDSRTITYCTEISKEDVMAKIL